jgi:hypothetical protein
MVNADAGRWSILGAGLQKNWSCCKEACRIVDSCCVDENAVSGTNDSEVNYS